MLTLPPLPPPPFPFHPIDSAVLLDPSDPFLPQSEDVALPATASLFTADGDFPPLHIDASDFQ